MAYRIYSLLPDSGQDMALDEVAARAGMDVAIARQVLHVLWAYDLIRAV
jgi:hypothetical protein